MLHLANSQEVSPSKIDKIESFNSRNSGPRILLVSLTAGRVELNFEGGDHLLFDNHWNPQLETQMQDRIYRFDQTKNVYIYKFICVNTIEERIKALQKRKLEITKNVLSGEQYNLKTYAERSHRFLIYSSL